jgi:outer membrane biosynthesis protein TonB
MLCTIGRLGITLLIASSLNIVSSSSNPLLARARVFASDSSIPSTDLWAAIAQVPEDSAPNRPQISPSSKPLRGLQCISGCYPKYPPELVGKEGRVLVRLVVDRNGNVIDAQVVKGTTVSELVSDQNSNLVPQAQQTSIDSQIAQAALVAARQMKFAPPTSGERMTVMIAINFAMAGSEFERQTRERQTQNEREREAKQEELNLTPLQ